MQMEQLDLEIRSKFIIIQKKYLENIKKELLLEN